MSTRRPEQDWAALAAQLDPRLPQQKDWGALSAMVDTAHAAGLNVEMLIRGQVDGRPLSHLPAQDLRYRLANLVPGGEGKHDPRAQIGDHTSTTADRNQQLATVSGPTRSPRR